MEPFCLIVIDGMLTDTDRGFIVTPPWPVVKMTAMGYEVRPVALAEMGTRTVRLGNQIELRRTEGSLWPSIMAVDHARVIARSSTFHLRVPKSVTREDVPLNTQVWWTASGQN
jgi:hypothetical protein